MNVPEENDELTLIQRHIDALMEHFDTVQIFVSKHDSIDNKTGFITKGAGNSYARYGQIKQWVIEDEEAARCAIRNEINEREGDE